MTTKTLPPKPPMEISPKAKAAKAKAACKHPYLVPLEMKFAKVKNIRSAKDPDWYYDYASNIMGANIGRVSSYYCSLCKREIKAPDVEE